MLHNKGGKTFDNVKPDTKIAKQKSTGHTQTFNPIQWREIFLGVTRGIDFWTYQNLSINPYAVIHLKIA